jgi:LysR family transcriptional regulator, low CO2-responsive transcriptional regulator
MKRLESLTFKQLRALDGVASTGSISRAAEMLLLTPPAVHSQIKALEANFGCAMVRRDSHGRFVLTGEGAALLQAHRRAQADLGLAVQRIDALQKGLAGTVVLGVVSTGKYFAPGLVVQLRKTHPDIEVVLKVGNRDTIISALEDRAIDLAIMGRPPRAPQVTAYVVGNHPHVLVVPPGHRLLSVGRIDPEDILNERFILREEGSGTRILCVRYLDRIGGGQPYESVEMESNETIKQAVIAGLGIALISFHTVTEELRTGRLIAPQIKDIPIMRSWFVLHRQDQTLPGATKRVLEFVRAQKDGFLPRL